MISRNFSAGDRKALGFLAFFLAAGVAWNLYQKGKQTAAPAQVLSSVELPAGYFNMAASSKPVPKVLGEPLDLNRATAEELEILPGIGPSLAERIVHYRQNTGGFKKVEELLKVPGIGPKKLAGMKSKIEIDVSEGVSPSPAGLSAAGAGEE